MTPSRKNNKHYPPESVIKMNSNASCYTTAQDNSLSHNHHQQRYDQSNRSQSGNVVDEKYYQNPHFHNNHSQNNNQKTSRKNPHKINRNDREFIPLFLLVDSCKEGNERKVREVCRKLMALEAEDAEPVVNFQDQTGRTALSYGCGCGSIAMIQEISRFRFTDPNLADNDGNAPLHYSSVCGHWEGVDLLLSRFSNVIDVNARNASGLTPLMKAALQGRTRCAKRLLIAGASPFMKDHTRGFTAAEWARLCGRHMCEEIINRSAQDAQDNNAGSCLVYSRTFPNLTEERSCQNRLPHEEPSYSHFYARSTVNGAKWLKNKIKKVLGASIRSGEDKSYVFDNPLVKNLADSRPHERNYSALTNLGLGGAALCAGSPLLPDIQPIVNIPTQRAKVPRKSPIPVVQITPVKRTG